VLEHLKENWRCLRTGRPGERFQRLYRMRQRSARSKLRKIVVLTIGVVVTGLGLFFLPAAGPGTPILLIGASMVAGESLLSARLFDWLELRLRKLISVAFRLWNETPLVLRAVIALCLVILLGAIAYAVYELFLPKATI
jgi:hypothetical protein